MNIKTLLTTAAVLFGTSTAALASPGHGPVVRNSVATTVVRHVTPRPTTQARTIHYRDHRGNPGNRWSVNAGVGYYAPTYYPSAQYVAPAPLYAPVAEYPTSRQYIPLGGLTGNGIELAMVSESTVVTQIEIHYQDGRSVMVPIEQSIDYYRPTLDIQTESCPIAGVTVFATGGSISALVI
jgi:hypothetical protein